MEITTAQWNRYIGILRKLDDYAYDAFLSKMQDCHLLDDFGNIVADIDDWGRKQLINSAYTIAAQSSEATAAVSAEMYSLMAEMQGKVIDVPELEPIPSIEDVAKTVNGVLKTSHNSNEMSSAVARLVKRTGVRTTRRNARRDRAEFAWIPSGDSCAFCLALASNGWQSVQSADHQEHIHANCDCTYAVRFDGVSNVEGYNPDEYRKEYYSADGSDPTEKINSIRRKYYDENKDKINAQKRAAYALRTEESND